jgi:hypothetical protein
VTRSFAWLRSATPKSSLEKLVPPERPDGGAPRYETWFDTERPGLALRLSSEGRVSCFLVTTHDGRSQRINLGRFPRMTVEQARARAREVDAEIVATGRNPNQQLRDRRAEGQRTRPATAYRTLETQTVPLGVSGQPSAIRSLRELC